MVFGRIAWRPMLSLPESHERWKPVWKGVSLWDLTSYPVVSFVGSRSFEALRCWSISDRSTRGLDVTDALACKFLVYRLVILLPTVSFPQRTFPIKAWSAALSCREATSLMFGQKKETTVVLRGTFYRLSHIIIPLVAINLLSFLPEQKIALRIWPKMLLSNAQGEMQTRE